MDKCSLHAHHKTGIHQFLRCSHVQQICDETNCLKDLAKVINIIRKQTSRTSTSDTDSGVQAERVTAKQKLDKVLNLSNKSQPPHDTSPLVKTDYDTYGSQYTSSIYNNNINDPVYPYLKSFVNSL